VAFLFAFQILLKVPCNRTPPGSAAEPRPAGRGGAGLSVLLLSQKHCHSAKREPRTQAKNPNRREDRRCRFTKHNAGLWGREAMYPAPAPMRSLKGLSRHRNGHLVPTHRCFTCKKAAQEEFSDPMDHCPFSESAGSAQRPVYTNYSL